MATRWRYGVPVPGVWTRAYENGWSANAEQTKAGHWRAVVLDAGFNVVASAACADVDDAKREAVIMGRDLRRGAR